MGLSEATTTDRQFALSSGPDQGNMLLDRQLCFAFYAASRLITRLYQPLLEPFGLTYPQYVALMVLWEDAPCSVSHIGARTLLNSNTLTPLLKRLERLRYIRRNRSAGDERIVNVSLTCEGIELKSKCACIPASLRSSINLTPEKTLALKDSVEELLRELQTISAPPTAKSPF
ncbi:MAG: MarR family transcriptional regulator [Capsulimonadaceae bacterium]|nr:MarR family transcriptional regulator [Capsulimonadaceae bacterium]